ncbi:DEKNAAC102639 [Brettanomyces naardenensis]|uniref:DEKNAAC102639 n=1 Tax=Brettanomyces naardenensis TaxID=13370 RepID=A0A448YLK5_BRENA|nr:DEKNAAC102639 [Brettanomyces naardenensis]
MHYSSLVSQLEVDEYIPSPLRLRLSSLSGSIALACWLVLIIPQLVEMWRVRNVDGISPLFLLSWTIGDVANVIGAIWGGLLPEVILTGLWFLFADISTLSCFYYLKYLSPWKIEVVASTDEESPLLQDSLTPVHSEGAIDSNRRKSHLSHHSRTSVRRRRHSSTVEDVLFEPKQHSLFVRYGLPIIFVVSAGIVGSFCSPNGGSHKAPESSQKTGPQICGYISAFLYLTARLPQIAKNYENKSCKGLSLLFFLLSTLANLNYGLQILFYRSDWEYIKLNSSWILGSMGTILEDGIIFVQFYLYGDENTKEYSREVVVDERASV